MVKSKYLLIGFIAVFLSAAMAGCGTQPQQAATDSDDKQSEVRIVRDDLGREVQVPEEPKRVLALNSSMTEIVFDLGVVPVGKVSEYVISRPEARDLPGISFENTPNIEMINKLAPDLIIAHAKNHAAILDSLEATGAAVVCVDPSKAEDQLVGRIDLIGEVLNRQGEAAAYAKKVEEKSARLREKIAGSPIKTALFIQGGSQNILAAQSFCFWGRLLSDLGIENIVPLKVSDTAKSGFITFDIETIIQKDPDAVLVLQPGFRSGDGQGKGKGQGAGANSNGPGPAENQSQNTGAAKSMSPEELLAIYQNDPMWKQLSAVKNGKLIIVPANIAPGKINGLEALDVTAQLIAPEAFE
jgi:iron complex transport system substrate-binding protein